jgi:hypothetical protein
MKEDFGRFGRWRKYSDRWFKKDPRYNAAIHGEFGAIFLKSPHEVDYNNTATGETMTETATWIRRKSENETIRETCNRYLNTKNNTPNKNNFPTSYDES